MVAEYNHFNVTVSAKEDFDYTMQTDPVVNFSTWTSFYGAMGGDRVTDAPLVKLTVTVIGGGATGQLRLQASETATAGLNTVKQIRRRMDIFGLDGSGDRKLVAQGWYEVRRTSTVDFT